MKLRTVAVALSVFITGCASFSIVGPGDLNYEGLKIQTSQAWNRTSGSRSGSEVWTQDGVLLDRLIIIPKVPSGESIFKPDSTQRALPVFKSDMLPNEIEELTESSLVNVFPEGEAAVETTNLRPHMFGEINGVLFDIDVVLSDGPNYNGVAGAFVENDYLYIILYLGASPYYYEKHLDEALATIKSARV